MIKGFFWFINFPKYSIFLILPDDEFKNLLFQNGRASWRGSSQAPNVFTNPAEGGAVWITCPLHLWKEQLWSAFSINNSYTIIISLNNERYLIGAKQYYIYKKNLCKNCWDIIFDMGDQELWLGISMRVFGAKNWNKRALHQNIWYVGRW